MTDSVQTEKAESPKRAVSEALDHVLGGGSLDDFEEAEDQIVVSDGVQDIQPGNVRLQGTFAGSATTQTHQLDLEMAMDVQLPSAMAEKAMRTLANGDNAIALQDGSDCKTIQKKKKSMWSSLADFFKKDAEAANVEQPQQIILADPNAANEQLQAIIEELHQKTSLITQLEGHIQEQEQEKNALEVKVEVLEHEQVEHAQLIQVLRRGNDRVQELEEKLNSQENHSYELEHKYRDSESLVTNLQHTVDNLRAEIDSITEDGNVERSASSKTAEEQRQQIDHFIERNGVLSSENGMLQEELSKLRAQISMDSMTEYQGTGSPKKSDAGDDTELEELHEKLGSARSEIDQLRAQVEALSAQEKQVNALRSELHDATEKAETLERRAADAKRSADHANARADAAEEGSQESCKSLQKDLEALTQRTAAAEAELAEAQRGRIAALKQVEALQQKASEMEVTTPRPGLLEEALANTTRAEKQRDQFRADCEQTHEKLEAMTEELAKEKERADAAEAELQSVAGTDGNQEKGLDHQVLAESKRLQAAAEAKMQKLQKDLETRRDKAEVQAKALSDNCEALTKEVNSLKQSLKNAESKLNTEQKSAATTEDKVQSLTEEVEQLRQEAVQREGASQAKFLMAENRAKSAEHSLEAQKNLQEKEMNALMDDLNKARAEVTEALAKANRADEEKINAGNSIAAAESKLKASQAREVLLEEQIALEKQKSQELQKKQAQFLVKQEKAQEGSTGEAGGIVDALKKQLDASVADRVRLEKDVSRLRGQVANQDKADAQIADLTKELQLARKGLAEEKRLALHRKTHNDQDRLTAGSQLETARSEIVSLKERLESALNEKAKGIQDVQSQINDTFELVTKAQGDLNAERQERIKAQMESKQLGQQVRTLEEHRQAIERDLEATRAMLSQIQQMPMDQVTVDTPSNMAPQGMTSFSFPGVSFSPQMVRTQSLQPPPTPVPSGRVQASPVIGAPQVVAGPPLVATPSTRRPGAFVVGGSMPKGGSVQIPPHGGSVQIPVNKGPIPVGGSVSIPVAQGPPSLRPPQVVVKAQQQIVGTLPMQQVFGGPMKDLKGNVQIKVKAIRRIK